MFGGSMKEKRPEYDTKELGRKLKYCREKKDLTVEAVRQYLRLSSVQAIYRWESGVALPTLDNFMALMDLYDVNPKSLMVKKEEYQQRILMEGMDNRIDYYVCV